MTKYVNKAIVKKPKMDNNVGPPTKREFAYKICCKHSSCKHFGCIHKVLWLFFQLGREEIKIPVTSSLPCFILKETLDDL